MIARANSNRVTILLRNFSKIGLFIYREVVVSFGQEKEYWHLRTTNCAAEVQRAG